MSETYSNNVGRSDYGLPTVNSNDNGKILQVVEGEWKKAEGGGGVATYNARWLFPEGANNVALLVVDADAPITGIAIINIPQASQDVEWDGNDWAYGGGSAITFTNNTNVGEFSKLFFVDGENGIQYFEYGYENNLPYYYHPYPYTPIP